MPEQLSLALQQTTKDSKTIRALIMHLLEVYPILRDDDYELWLRLLAWVGISPNDSIAKLIRGMQDSVVPPLDSVTRIRRMVQTERSDLRGKLWDERHARGEEHRINVDQLGG